MTGPAPAAVTLVAAAAIVAGPGASSGKVEETLVSLALMAEEESPTMRRLARILGAQRFVAEFVSVRIEESSTRAVLALQVKPTADAPDGVEQIRTDRTDHRDGARMFRLAQKLVGHRVIVFKVLEDMDGQPNRKVRVAVHLVDLGPGPGRESPIRVRQTDVARGVPTAAVCTACGETWAATECWWKDDPAGTAMTVWANSHDCGEVAGDGG